MQQTGEIILYQPNESVQLEVRLEEESVWLTQQQMALLFGTQRQAITKHIKNIYDCAELDKLATSSILEQVQKEGNRLVNRRIEYYNLDVIISVGYRVNTIRGIQFRQWANKVLKDYLLKGYALNQRLLKIENQLENQQTLLAEHSEKIDFSETVYHIGASLKDLGKKWFAFSKMDITSTLLLSKL